MVAAELGESLILEEWFIKVRYDLLRKFFKDDDGKPVVFGYPPGNSPSVAFVLVPKDIIGNGRKIVKILTILFVQLRLVRE